MILFWLLTICVLHILLLHQLSVYAVLYEITIDSFEPHPDIDKTSISLGSIRVTRKKRNNFVLSGDFEILQNWGNENMNSYEIKNSIGAVIARGKAPFCDMFNSDNVYMVKLRSHSTFPPGSYCPLPKNRYTVTDLEFDETDLPVVAIKDTYTITANLIAPDGHRVLTYSVKFTVK